MCVHRVQYVEVHFGYQEAGEKKEALVKLRACEECAYKLNYGRTTALKKVVKTSSAAKGKAGRGKGKKNKKDDRRRQRRRREGGDEDDDERGKGSKRRKEEEEEDSDSDSDSEESSSGGEDDDEDKEEDIGPTGEAGEEIWLGKANQHADAEPTKEEEFDQYFADMFM